MGKLPLASLIGACGIGLLLSGCTNTKQNTNSPFAGGKTNTSMGLLSHGKAANTASTPLAGAPATPSASSSTIGAMPGSETMGASGNSSPNLSLNGASMDAPGNPVGSPAMGKSPYPSLTPPNGSSTSMGTTSLGGSLSSADPNLSPPITPSGAGSGRLPSPGIQQASLQGADSSVVRDAGYHATDIDNSANLPVNGRNTAMMIPPVPSSSSAYSPPPSSPTASIPAKSTSSSTALDTSSAPASSSSSAPAPLPPLSPSAPMGSGSANSLMNPPPTVSVGSSSTLPPPSPTTPASPSLPGYLK